MKKNTLRLLLTTVFTASLLSLTACHGSKGMEPFSMPEGLSADKTYEITFWAKNDTNLTQAAIYNEAISDFEKLYPNIKVNMRLYTDYGRIYNDVITNISTNTTPNVCVTYPDHIATYLTGTNTVVPLDDLIGDEKYGLMGSELHFDCPGEIVNKFLEECRLGDNLFAVPYMRSTECMYINKTLVEKLGYEIPETPTWDFVWEVSQKAMEKNANGTFKINNQMVMIPFIYKSTDNMMIQQLKQKNADYSDTDGNIKLFNDTTKELLWTVDENAKLEAFSTFKISSYPGNFLNAGQCIFAVDSTAGATWMGSKAPNLDISEDKLVDFEMVITRVPQFDPENPLMISQGPSICIFNKEDNEEVLASWLFTQYLLSNKVQIAYSETEGYSPVTVNALTDPEYLDYLSKEDVNSSDYYAPKIQAVKLLIDNIDNTFITPVFNGSASLRDAAGQLIESVTKSERRGEKIDDTYFDKLFKDTASLYHLDSGKKANTGTQEKADLGPLPGTSLALLFGILGVWFIIAVVYFKGLIKAKNSKK